MRDDENRVDGTGIDTASFGDPAFIIFALEHAGCGEEGAIELRLGERSLLGWCASCAVLRTFGSFYPG